MRNQHSVLIFARSQIECAVDSATLQHFHTGDGSDQTFALPRRISADRIDGICNVVQEGEMLRIGLHRRLLSASAELRSYSGELVVEQGARPAKLNKSFYIEAKRRPVEAGQTSDFSDHVIYLRLCVSNLPAADSAEKE
ncbi:hypothetical protein D3C71_1743630 [compost metagenome]